jgi:hypothetical protein
MGRAEAIVSRLDATLRRFTPTTRTAYKRKVTRTGGSALLGRPGTVTNTDTLLDPQPYFVPIGREPVSGGHAQVESVITGGSKQYTADDYKFLFSPTAYTLAEFQDEDFYIVLKDSAGNEEVLKIMDVRQTDFTNVTVLITVFARPIKRP